MNTEWSGPQAVKTHVAALAAEVPAWNPTTALALHRATLHRIADVWAGLDVFDKPSLARRDIVAARQACDAAWVAQDLAALRQALATWEVVLTGRGG